MHPRDQAREHERDDELALLVREVGEVDHGGARTAVLGAEEHGRIERGAAAPGGERGRGDERVQPDGELVPLCRRQERVDLEDAELAQRRLLDLPDQGAEIEIGAGAPVVLEQVREEDVLAAAERVGLDPDQAEQAGDGALDLVADRLLVGLPRERRRLQRADHVQRHAGLGAGRVERHLGRVAERLDPLGSIPAPARPRCQSSAVFCAYSSGVWPASRAADSSIQGRKLAAERSGKVSARLPMSPFGSRISAGTPLRERLLEQDDPEAGLARAGHPDDDRVRGQIVRIEDELATVEELAEPVAVRHGASLPRRGDADAPDRALRTPDARDCRPMQRRPDQEERVTTLVCLECGDESDEAGEWRAYLDDEDVLVYCAACAKREFGP